MSPPVEELIALGKRQDALYTEWAKVVGELLNQEGTSIEIEKHQGDIVRAFACMRGAVATEIGRRILAGGVA